MAGDWIKMELATPDKPEVFELAEIYNIDPDAVFGKLFRVWSWFDIHTESGNAPTVTKTLINRITSVNGFADGMIKVGWLVQTEQGLQVPNFDRHNGETGKKRALTAKRVAKHKSKTNADDNAKLTQEALPKEEKRREEIKEKKQKKFTPPNLKEVTDYCNERSNQVTPQTFIDHYEANGWVRGKTKIKDWKACVRTWEKNSSDNGNKTEYAAGAL